MSMLEYLQFRNPNQSEDQILSKMKEQGLDSEKLLAEHQQQIACEQNLATVLKKLDIGFRITKSYILLRRMVDASKCVEWADLVIPIGGDGTFLLASKLITDNQKPVLGINPNTSKKSIFTIPPKYTVDIDVIFDKLRTGNYKLLMRSRIRTVMNGTGLYRRPFHIHEKSRTYGERRAEALNPSTQRKIADALQPRQRILPWLALNEVFMGEFLAARPISLIVQVNNQKYHVRSSGICVCTGSGSHGWFKSMNYQSAETVRNIFEIATGKKLSPEETDELLRKYHESLSYPVEDLQMTLKIREMYLATRCVKNKCCPDKVKCFTLTVISRGFDAALVIDGSISIPFNDGTLASFEIKPEYALKNIVLT
ncbi:NAD kinase 2, mitochondrial-like [Ceratina calcarata]|uniref:NAD(+) kinase n=1 Tax=Ceratina calcarata TaxID=156304 RepID=A0AAJ7NBW7_9HYME|nr:NAD kinase 2, mitochondrial-like [Ceratina calcarata]